MAFKIKYNKYLLFILILLLCSLVYFKKSTNKTDKIYTAIIVEPRKHKALHFVMKNFLDNLDKRWNFIIFHGTKNRDFVLDMIKNDFHTESNRINLINLNVDNLYDDDYSTLFLKKSFYENIPTEMFLVFQTDSIICSNFKEKIYDFMKYDYVGAPWSSSKEIGNGGLSLRRKSKMLEIIENCKYNHEPEDAFFSRGCDAVPCSKPSFEKGKEFSIEQVYSENSFGVHKPWFYIDKADQIKINRQCEGYNELIKLYST